MFITPGQRRLVAALLIVLMAAVLAQLFAGLAFAQFLARLALLGLVLAAGRGLGLREILLLTACVIASLLLGRQGAWATLLHALDQAAFLAAFIQLMGLLREAAAQSPAVRDCGAWLTGQPPKRRYLAIHAGGHAFGVLLNFGAISLLAPLVQLGVKADAAPADIAAIRERRQLSALIRGFAWIVVWAPTSVTQALLVVVVADVHPGHMAALGFLTALLMMALGWLEDTLRWRTIGARLRASGRVPALHALLPRRALRHLAGICAMLLTLTVGLKLAAGVPTVHALMLTAPLALLIWVMVQNLTLGPAGAARALGARLRQIAHGPIPLGVRETVTLASSGFIGVAAAALLPVEAIAGVVAAGHLDPALFLWSLPLLIVLAGQIALSPIMMVVFLGAVLAAFPTPPADPTLTAFALASGWALSMTAAPNVTGALLLSRITGHPPILLTWRWNFTFSLLAFALLGLLFWLLTRLA